VTIYNILGEQIRRLSALSANTGENQMIWDGHDDSGNRIPKGIYFCHLQTAKNEYVIKMLYK
jgi:flagellar hook assembly protein FlgD